MQSLDTTKTAGPDMPVDDQGVRVGSSRVEDASATTSPDVELAEAVARRRDRRIALLLMILSCGIVIAACIIGWLALLH
jgi:hypothetical protein